METDWQTKLNTDDITEHHDMLEQLHCFGLLLSIDRRQVVSDEMVYRFVHTFIEPESEDTE